MESRKNIITTSGEGHVLSPRERKAVNGMETFMELTEDSSSISFPLRNLIPEITGEGNLLSSFNRVIRNLRQSSSDGKKCFPGKVMRLGSIQNKALEIHDYEIGMSTSQGEDRYLVSFRDQCTGEWGKFFTASEEMKNILDQISDIEDGFPFETTIVSEIFDGNKQKFSFT